MMPPFFPGSPVADNSGGSFAVQKTVFKIFGIALVVLIGGLSKSFGVYAVVQKSVGKVDSFVAVAVFSITGKVVLFLVNRH